MPQPATSLPGTTVLSRIGLGTRPFDTLADDPARALVRRALELGVTLFDCSDSFGDGRAERILGEVLPGDGTVALVTKGGRRSGFGSDELARALEESCRRLRRDSIPLYLLDRPTTNDLRRHRPLETLARLRDKGRAALIGACVDGEEEGRAVLEAGAQALEVPFNILEPTVGYRLIQEAAARGAVVLVREPLARGRLSGRYGPGATFAPTDSRWARIPDDLAEVARKVGKLEFLRRQGRTLAQAAILFVLGHEGVSSVLVGARTPEQLEEAVAAPQAPPLTMAELERIFELTAGCFLEE